MDTPPFYYYLLFGTKVTIEYSLVCPMLLSPVYTLAISIIEKEHVTMQKSFVFTFTVMMVSSTTLFYMRLLGLKYELFFWDITSMPGELLYLTTIGIAATFLGTLFFRGENPMREPRFYAVTASTIAGTMFIIYLFLIPVNSFSLLKRIM